MTRGSPFATMTVAKPPRSLKGSPHAHHTPPRPRPANRPDRHRRCAGPLHRLPQAPTQVHGLQLRPDAGLRPAGRPRRQPRAVGPDGRRRGRRRQPPERPGAIHPAGRRSAARGAPSRRGATPGHRPGGHPPAAPLPGGRGPGQLDHRLARGVGRRLGRQGLARPAGRQRRREADRRLGPGHTAGCGGPSCRPAARPTRRHRWPRRRCRPVRCGWPTWATSTSRRWPTWTAGGSIG